MRIALALGMMMSGAVMLEALPAEAAIAPVTAVGTLTTAGQPVIQKVWWRWHGRRYWHRRWAPRHFAGGAWIPGGWIYF